MSVGSVSEVNAAFIFSFEVVWVSVPTHIEPEDGSSIDLRDTAHIHKSRMNINDESG
jgi:hypothetical protein